MKICHLQQMMMFSTFEIHKELEIDQPMDHRFADVPSELGHRTTRAVSQAILGDQKYTDSVPSTCDCGGRSESLCLLVKVPKN